MAELMRLESSKYESNQLGCMWGVLQYFDFHQRQNRRKMLAYRKHGDGKQSRGTRLATTKENALSLLDRETNSQMENEDSVTVASKSFGKSLMRTLLHRKMSKKRDKRGKISPSASQMLRTISIHHLECNDYVLPDEMTSDSESSAVELNSQETGSSASSEYIMLLPRGSDRTIFGNQHEAHETMDTTTVLMEKLIKAKEALIKQKDAGANVAPQLNDLLDKIELFNTNRNLLLEVLEDPNSDLVKNLLALQTSNGTLGLNKSASFPETKLLGRTDRKSILKDKLKVSKSFIDPEVKSPAGNSIQDDLQVTVPMAGADAGIPKSGNASVNTAGIGSRNGKSVLSRWKDFKQRIKDVVKENKKEHRRISMDGILHKVPVGQKLPEDLEKEKLGEIARIKLGVHGPNYSNRKFARRSVQRSRSLTESIDRYSYLLESISVKESKRFPESLKPIQEDGGLQDRKLPKTFGRIFSSPEFRTYSFSKYFESEVSHAALSSEKPASNLPLGDDAVVTYGSDEPKPIGILLNTEEGLKSDKAFVQSTIQVNANDDNLEETALVDEHKQSGTCVVSDELMTGESSSLPIEQGHEVEMDPMDKPTKPSPASVLDSHFRENPVSPTKYAVSEGVELQSNWIHFEELEAVTKTKDLLGDGDSQELELVKFDEEQIPKDTNDVSSFNVHVDREEEAEFNYVKDVLIKSGLIGGAEGLGRWLSPYQTEVDSLLFGDAEGSPLDLETTLDESLNVPLYRQLLFDLINEVLLEIYESCVAQSTSFLQFDRRIRPIPVGNHVIEEVWAKIRWHISTQRHLNPTLDYYVARDLAKDDEWMNLHWDSEYIGVKLECLILDNLLDDIICDFGVV